MNLKVKMKILKKVYNIRVDKDSKKYINSLKSKKVEDRNSWSSYDKFKIY
jgi:hypothetical protein